MQPWYLEPEPLAILASFDGKPAVEWHEKRYAITTDKWATFNDERYDRLYAMWSARFSELDAIKPYPTEQASAIIAASPENILGAMFGDPDGNDHFRTHRDRSPEWAAIREMVAHALAPKVAA